MTFRAAIAPAPPGWLTTRIPVGLSEKMAAKSVGRFSERIGHSMAYELVWP